MNVPIESVESQMIVVSCDGHVIGVVESVLASELKVGQIGARAHALPLAFIRDVDDKVRLVVTEAEARRRWRDVG